MKDVKEISIPESGGIICVNEDSTIDDMKQLRDALVALWPERKFILVKGTVNLLDEKTMNESGWFKKD